MASRHQRHMLEAGAQAPDFELKSLDGSTESLRGILTGGPALLAFFKVSCPVCQFTFPFLERLHQGGRLRVFAVSQDNARDTGEFNAEYGITMPTLLDGKGYRASNDFGVTNVPSLFLVEPDGRVSASVSGFSRRDLEALGRRFGDAALFQPGEFVPEWRGG